MGFAAGKVDQWLVGWGMVPRGEVGLIFAATGLSLKVIDQRLFSMMVIVIMCTPPILALLMRRRNARRAAMQV